MTTTKTITDKKEPNRKELIEELERVQRRYKNLLSEARSVPGFPLEYRVLDAPNSVWQPVYENQEWDLNNEIYRVRSDDDEETTPQV